MLGFLIGVDIVLMILAAAAVVGVIIGFIIMLLND